MSVPVFGLPHAELGFADWARDGFSSCHGPSTGEQQRRRHRRARHKCGRRRTAYVGPRCVNHILRHAFFHFPQSLLTPKPNTEAAVRNVVTPTQPRSRISLFKSVVMVIFPIPWRKRPPQHPNQLHRISPRPRPSKYVPKRTCLSSVSAAAMVPALLHPAPAEWWRSLPLVDGGCTPSTPRVAVYGSSP